MNMRHPTAWACAILFAVLSLSQTMARTPLLQMYETNICRAYYQTSNNHSRNATDGLGFDEARCKITVEVQQELAFVQGVDTFVSAIVELLTMLPYTTLAERISRQKILQANVLSGVLAQAYILCICGFREIFSIRLIWAQSLFRFFGGTDSVQVSLINTLIAETILQDDLSKTFLIISSMRFVVHATTQLVSARLMSKSPWLPALTGIILYALAIPPLIIIKDPREAPTTPSSGSAVRAGFEADIACDSDAESSAPLLRSSEDSTSLSSTTNDESDNRRVPGSDNAESIQLVSSPVSSFATRDSTTGTIPTPLLVSKPATASILVWSSLSLSHAFGILGYLLRDPIAAPTLVLFFWNEVGHGVNIILEQWTSSNFTWSLTRVNYLLGSLRFVAGATTLALSETVRRLQRAGYNMFNINMGVVWFSQMATDVGILGATLTKAGGGHEVQFICSTILYIMGWGMKGTLQSAVTAVSDKAHITRLYMGISAAERLGSILNGPIYMGLLAKAVQQREGWAGLPFLFALCSFLLVTGLAIWLSYSLSRIQKYYRVSGAESSH